MNRGLSDQSQSGLRARTELDDKAVSLAHRIGRFFLWLFAIIGFASTAFWLAVLLFLHHVAVT